MNQEFDAIFFKNIAVPIAKDYSRLSSSPTRDADCDSSYFKRFTSDVDCDTPVKMRLPKMDEQCEDEAGEITNTNENLLSSSSSSSTLIENVTVAPAPQAAEKRAPLKIVPMVEVSKSEEHQVIEDFAKLSMFNAPEPEERLSQRRRSELKKKQEEDNKRRSELKATSGTVASESRNRSSSVKRAGSREPSVSRIPLGQRSRANSVTREQTNAPTVSMDSGVVTRSMAKAAASSEGLPAVAALKEKEKVVKTSSAPLSTVRKPNGPLKIAAKTPVAPIVNDGSTRSRDRTRRTNTTGLSGRTSMLNPNPKTGVSTPVVPPRRALSGGRATPSGPSTIKGRPIATANRTSILRASAVKQQVQAEKDAKPVVTRPVVGSGVAGRTRAPLRVEPTAATQPTKNANTTTVKPANVPRSAARPVRQPVRVMSSALRSSSASGRTPAPNAQSSAKPLSTQDTNALFSRLSTPKTSATPVRLSHPAAKGEGLRKSAVRPVPSYIRSVTKNGLPTVGGLHGLRAPSKERVNKAGSTDSLHSTARQLSTAAGAAGPAKPIN